MFCLMLLKPSTCDDSTHRITKHAWDRRPLPVPAMDHFMKIQVNSDNQTNGGEELNRQVEAIVNGALGQLDDRITRVEVHLSDENSSAKLGHDDKRCAMEARLAGFQPIAVTHQGPTLDRALEGAADKLKKTLDSTLGRLENPKGRTPYGGKPAD